MLVRSTIEAQLSLHKHERAPEAQERQENGMGNYEPDEVRNFTGVTVQYSVSYKRVQ